MASLLSDLGQNVASFAMPSVDFFTIDARDVASSSLQKSLRRGNFSTALNAAKTLLEKEPAYFWRRLVTITVEDFGLSDLNLTQDVVAAAQNRAWRQYSGQTLKAAAYLICRLIQTPRDRRIDDLYMLAHACLKSHAYQQRVDQASQGVPDLVEEAKRLCLLCERAVPMRSVRALDVRACENFLQKWNDEALVELIRRSRKISQCLLPLLLPLWLKLLVKQEQAVELLTDPIEIRSHNGILLVALDGYTAMGRAILADVVAKGTPLHRFIVSSGLAPRGRTAAMLLFAVEGAVLPQKLADPLSHELEQLARGCWSGLPPARIPEGLALMQSLLPEIQSRRLEALASSQRSSFNTFQGDSP